MAKKKGLPLGTFLKRFSSEAQCQEYLASQRRQTGYVCAKCGCRHGYRLSNGRYQCAKCRRQTSVTAGTVLHKTHQLCGVIEFDDAYFGGPITGKKRGRGTEKGFSRKSCVKVDKRSSRKREQIKGLPGEGAAQLNQDYSPVFRDGRRYARAA